MTTLPVLSVQPTKLAIKVVISFSGGKTSAYMAMRLTEELKILQRLGIRVEILVIFANTSQEHEKTLEYVNNCDKQFSLNVVWVEAVFNPQKGIGTTHRVVTFETAKRKGEVFEQMIEKYGLPNPQFSHCTREIKLHPMRSYFKSIGWTKGTYQAAIGIRADEADRMSVNAVEEGIFYPLVGWGVTKADILAWDKTNPFALGLPEHYGNCVWCWKKSLRKLATLANEAPQFLDFPERMQNKHKDTGAGSGNRIIFRKSMTVADLKEAGKKVGFIPYSDEHVPEFDDQLDVGSGCSESCEVFADKE